MKKVLLIGQFPPPVKGISISNKTLYDGLLKKGYKVDYINTEFNSNEISTDFGKFSFSKLAFLKSYLYIYKVFYYKNIYITIGITFFGIFKYSIFILLSSFLYKNLVVHVHSNYLSTEYDNLKGIKKIIVKFLMRKFNKGIVLSDSLTHNLEHFLKKKDIFIVPNFIQDDLLNNKSIIKNYSEIRLFFLSNLIEEKGINILLKVIKKLNDENIIIKTKIAGSMVQNNPLPLLNELCNVEYLGVVENVNKVNLLEWGNVFCLPTYYSMEGQPISIIEAMAFNNFIVTTKHAGIPDICSTKNAIFCEKKSIESLYNVLKKLHKNWNNYSKLAKNNGKYAEENFKEDDFVNKISNLFVNKIF